eukprot:9246243-Pyramimonas_sp.AAC.1
MPERRDPRRSAYATLETDSQTLETAPQPSSTAAGPTPTPTQKINKATASCGGATGPGRKPTTDAGRPGVFVPSDIGSCSAAATQRP